jgi:hypothetical protein
MHTTERNDANLVAESLDGSRDAFRQIVERYQPLMESRKRWLISSSTSA